MRFPHETVCGNMPNMVNTALKVNLNRQAPAPPLQPPRQVARFGRQLKTVNRLPLTHDHPDL
jgi:hypothetical protein